MDERLGWTLRWPAQESNLAWESGFLTIMILNDMGRNGEGAKSKTEPFQLAKITRILETIPDVISPQAALLELIIGEQSYNPNTSLPQNATSQNPHFLLYNTGNPQPNCLGKS